MKLDEAELRDFEEDPAPKTSKGEVVAMIFGGIITILIMAVYFLMFVGSLWLAAVLIRIGWQILFG